MRDQDNGTSNGTGNGTGPDDAPLSAMREVLQRLTEVNERLKQMTLAAEDRDAVGQAKGILMERYGSAHDEALELLMTASRNSCVVLIEVAVTLIHSGRLPLTADEHA
jgi:AmiR/NasT family two-component response regulator